MLETVRACFSLVTEAAMAVSDTEFDELEVTVEVARASGLAETDHTRKESPRARWTPQSDHQAIADHTTLRLGRVVSSSGKTNAAAAGTIGRRTAS